MIILDRRMIKDVAYRYGYVGIGFFYDKDKFSAELPDAPESGVMTWTLSESQDYFFVCQETNGAFLFAQRIDKFSACTLEKWELICVD